MSVQVDGDYLSGFGQRGKHGTEHVDRAQTTMQQEEWISLPVYLIVIVDTVRHDSSRLVGREPRRSRWIRGWWCCLRRNERWRCKHRRCEQQATPSGFAGKHFSLHSLVARERTSDRATSVSQQVTFPDGESCRPRSPGTLSHQVPDCDRLIGERIARLAPQLP